MITGTSVYFSEGDCTSWPLPITNHWPVRIEKWKQPRAFTGHGANCFSLPPDFTHTHTHTHIHKKSSTLLQGSYRKFSWHHIFTLFFWNSEKLSISRFLIGRLLEERFNKLILHFFSKILSLYPLKWTDRALISFRPLTDNPNYLLTGKMSRVKVESECPSCILITWITFLKTRFNRFF